MEMDMVNIGELFPEGLNDFIREAEAHGWKVCKPSVHTAGDWTCARVLTAHPDNIEAEFELYLRRGDGDWVLAEFGYRAPDEPWVVEKYIDDATRDEVKTAVAAEVERRRGKPEHAYEMGQLRGSQTHRDTSLVETVYLPGDEAAA